MRVRNHGKYTRMNKNSPHAIGRCDYSGMMVQHRLMKRQLQYRGNGLIDTGYLVNPKFYDQPNPQDLNPLIKIDPLPVLNARPDNNIDAYNPQILVLDVSGGSNVTLTPIQFSNINFVFQGLLTANIIIFVPAVFNDFFVRNITTGGFALSMQIINNSPTLIEIPSNDPSIPSDSTLIVCDSMSLSIVNNN